MNLADHITVPEFIGICVVLGFLVLAIVSFFATAFTAANDAADPHH